MACYDFCLETLSMSSSLDRYEPKRISINKKRYYIVEGFPNVPDGKVFPSVTTVLSSMAPLSKVMALINWRKRVGEEEANRRTRLAANRGTWLHGVLEDWFMGEDIENHLDSVPEWKQYFNNVEPFLAAIEKPVLIESAVAWYCEEDNQGFSGTLDMVAQMSNGGLALIDWKTSYKEKPDYQLADYKRQLGAYSMAAEQMYGIPVEEAWCVISCFDPEGDSEPSLQLLNLSSFELMAQQVAMKNTVTDYFNQHYPGGTAFSITQDRG